MEIPLRRLACSMLEEGGPYLLLEAGGDDEVEIVGNIDASHEAVYPGGLLVEGKDAGECSCVVGNPEELQGPPAQEGAAPRRLPLPGEEGRGMLRPVEEGVPAGLLDGLEAGERLNLHRSHRHPRSFPRPLRDPPCPRRLHPKPRPWPLPDHLRGPRPSPAPCA